MFSWLQVLMKHKIKKLIRLIKYFLFYSVDYVAVLSNLSVKFFPQNTLSMVWSLADAHFFNRPLS